MKRTSKHHKKTSHNGLQRPASLSTRSKKTGAFKKPQSLQKSSKSKRVVASSTRSQAPTHLKQENDDLKNQVRKLQQRVKGLQKRSTRKEDLNTSRMNASFANTSLVSASFMGNMSMNSHMSMNMSRMSMSVLHSVNQSRLQSHTTTQVTLPTPSAPYHTLYYDDKLELLSIAGTEEEPSFEDRSIIAYYKQLSLRDTEIDTFVINPNHITLGLLLILPYFKKQQKDISECEDTSIKVKHETFTLENLPDKILIHMTEQLKSPESAEAMFKLFSATRYPASMSEMDKSKQMVNNLNAYIRGRYHETYLLSCLKELLTLNIDKSQESAIFPLLVTHELIPEPYIQKFNKRLGLKPSHHLLLCTTPQGICQWEKREISTGITEPIGHLGRIFSFRTNITIITDLAVKLFHIEPVQHKNKRYMSSKLKSISTAWKKGTIEISHSTKNFAAHLVDTCLTHVRTRRQLTFDALQKLNMRLELNPSSQLSLTLRHWLWSTKDFHKTITGYKEHPVIGLPQFTWSPVLSEEMANTVDSPVKRKIVRSNDTTHSSPTKRTRSTNQIELTASS